MDYCSTALDVLKILEILFRKLIKWEDRKTGSGLNYKDYGIKLITTPLIPTSTREVMAKQPSSTCRTKLIWIYTTNLHKRHGRASVPNVLV